MPFPLCSIHARSLRTRLVIATLAACMFLTGALSAFSWIYARGMLWNLTEQYMQNQLLLLKNLVHTHFRTALKSHFRAASDSLVAEAGYWLARGRREGDDARARQSFLALVAAHRYGRTGYASVVGSDGIIKAHPVPEMVGTDISGTPVGEAVMGQPDGLREYQWKEPWGETREKVLYSVYFPAWDWYLVATGYREEFLDFVSVDDLEDAMKPLGFGPRGYAVVFDLKGVMLTHPAFKGVSFLDRQDAMGDVIRTCVKYRNGRVDYLWQNPGETEFRRKFAVYAEVPEFRVIVGATAYESEILAPLSGLGTGMITGTAGALFLLVFLAIRFSAGILRPLDSLRVTMDSLAVSEISARAPEGGYRETREIARSFNALLDRLRDAGDRLVSQERSLATGRVVARLAHRLNSPLGTGITTASYLEELRLRLTSNAGQPGDIVAWKEGMHLLQETLGRMGALVDALGRLKVDEGGMPPVPVDDLEAFLAREWAGAWKGRLPAGIRMDLAILPGCALRVVVPALVQVLDELVRNAVHHGYPEGATGLITISGESTGDRVCLRVENDGCPVPVEMADSLFEPFGESGFHNDARGLGLATVHALVTLVLGGEHSPCLRS